MKIIWGLIAIFSTSIVNATSISVSDHRVVNLSCKSVTRDSVGRALRPEQFGAVNHLAYQNWSFQWGFYRLAGCWSLSRMQRLYFYLREPTAGLSLVEHSNQIRSHDMYEDEQGWKAFPLKKFWFMPDQFDPRWSDWARGWSESGRTPQSLERGLRPDVEYYQAMRFHQLENLRYLRGPLARTEKENIETWNEMSALLAGGRMPLIVLRPDVYYQHVVIAKRFELSSTGARIWVYDSNSPWLDRQVLWDKKTSTFTAFDVVDGLPINGDSRAPLGVFIVDKNENERLLASLATHYKAICARP